MGAVTTSSVVAVARAEVVAPPPQASPPRSILVKHPVRQGSITVNGTRRVIGFSVWQKAVDPNHGLDRFVCWMVVTFMTAIYRTRPKPAH